jgi:hypothetical protein
MAQLRQLNFLIAVDVFEFTQCLLDGAKQVVGGIALAMASIALMTKPVHFGALKQHRLGR